MTRLKIYLLLITIGIGMLVVGAEQTYTYWTNRSPTIATLQGYVASKPSATYVQLTNCELDLLHAVELQSSLLHRDRSALIPLRVPGSRPDWKPPVFLLTTTQRWIQLVASHGKTTQPSSGTMIEGMVMGTVDGYDLVQLLRDKRLANPDVVIITDGAKPDSSATLQFVGLFATAIVILWLVFRKRAARPAAPPPLPAR